MLKEALGGTLGRANLSRPVRYFQTLSNNVRKIEYLRELWPGDPRTKQGYDVRQEAGLLMSCTWMLKEKRKIPVLQKTYDHVSSFGHPPSTVNIEQLMSSHVSFY